MITEDYVSFEAAKLLKGKGFDVPVERFYNNDGLWCRGASQYNWNDDKDINDGTSDYSMPSIYIAMKWLRERKQIFIHIERCKFKFFFTTERMNEPSSEYSLGHFKEFERNTYEEACEAAIKYCLKHLI